MQVHISAQANWRRIVVSDDRVQQVVVAIRSEHPTKI